MARTTTARSASARSIFIDGPVRVDGVEGVVGQQAAEAGITVTGTEQAVHVDLDVDDAELLAVGDTVDVELPTGEVVARHGDDDRRRRDRRPGRHDDAAGRR